MEIMYIEQLGQSLFIILDPFWTTDDITIFSPCIQSNLPSVIRMSVRKELAQQHKNKNRKKSYKLEAQTLFAAPIHSVITIPHQSTGPHSPAGTHQPNAKCIFLFCIATFNNNQLNDAS